MQWTLGEQSGGRFAGRQAYAYTGGRRFDPALPCAVLIHGVQNDHSVWALQSRYFAHHGFGVLAVDLPGHGRGDPIPLTSVEDMADWVMAVVDAAGVRGPVCLIGHSMGSLIALEAAARHPARVARVSLIATASPMKVSEMLLGAARDEQDRAAALVTEWSHAGLAPKPSCPGPGFWLLGSATRLMEHISTAHATSFHAGFRACDSYTGAPAAAHAVAAAGLPVQFILGRRDMMTPPRAAAGLQQAIPGARTTLLDCGHAVMAEQPDATLDALFAFCTSPAGAKAAA